MADLNPHAHRRVLVVDDNRDAADTLAMALALDDYQASTAYNGLEALAEVKCFPADVVILDLNMPGMDGYEAAAALKQRSPAPYLIALSADGSLAARSRTAEVGFDLHVTKPVDVHSLIAAIDQWPGRGAMAEAQGRANSGMPKRLR